MLKKIKKKILVTGGLGFIGTNLLNYLSSKKKYTILNIDKFSYASNTPKIHNPDVKTLKIDLIKKNKVFEVFSDFKPDAVFNLAAETHVDRSITNPKSFINSNILGTYNLLEAIRFHGLKTKLIHISTDEVFGDLSHSDKPFQESTPYNPSSPYSASKASSDFLVKSWGRTYGINYVVTNCSNNFGPYQNKEKLIPKVIMAILNKKKIPIYGNGAQIRDWLYVIDHCIALERILNNFKNQETYNIGANNQIKNIDLIKKICLMMDKKIFSKEKSKFKSSDLISFVKDRPGHDIKYAIDNSKIVRELNWAPKFELDKALNNTIQWYLSRYASDKSLS